MLATVQSEIARRLTYLVCRCVASHDCDAASVVWVGRYLSREYGCCREGSLRRPRAAEGIDCRPPLRSSFHLTSRLTVV